MRWGKANGAIVNRELPNLSPWKMLDQRGVLRRSEIAGPDDSTGGKVGSVVNPFVIRFVIPFVSNKYKVISRSS